MIKLLIVDDEPLICVAVNSMLKWEEFNIKVIGTARNGKQAEEMIHQHHPEIVITDIKMPVMTGMELAEQFSRDPENAPLFIFLTSFEEYNLVKQAIRVQAVDYLIKLEVNRETLGSAVRKCITILQGRKKIKGNAKIAQRSSLQSLQEKFFLRLYNSLFESEEQYEAQRNDLGIDFSSPWYAVAHCSIKEHTGSAVGDKLLEIYTNTIQMVKETLGKTAGCYITSLDLRHFNVMFCLDDDSIPSMKIILEEILMNTISVVRNCFSVSLVIAVGIPVNSPFRVEESYLSARRLLHGVSENKPLVFPGANEVHDSNGGFSNLRPVLRRAFEEMNTGSLYDAISEIISIYSDQPGKRIEAMDAACNILYMAISLLPGGETLLNTIFADDQEKYRSIYRMSSVEAICGWLAQLRDGCCDVLSKQRQNYKQQVVSQVHEYIQENLNKPLSLQEVAAVFNFSPNYLSQLFSKYGGEGFVEYITAAKVKAAKEMLSRNEGRVYEIAERLGFDNPFYFSKVFKKIEGISPRDYVKQLEEGAKNERPDFYK